MNRNEINEDEVNSEAFLKSVFMTFILLILLVLAQLGYGINQLDVLQGSIQINATKQFNKTRLINEAEVIDVKNVYLLNQINLSVDLAEREKLFETFRQHNKNGLDRINQLLHLEKNPAELKLIENLIHNLQDIENIQLTAVNISPTASAAV
mgnify:CR=1 FL=1